ncbi:MAG TPA: tetratricopeptide repeat protein [Candidatus Coatesbacteria bacterium]|nr:tetratricopeptide repeat protein [Candidatus Coatesbacteria bacterium]
MAVGEGKEYPDIYNLMGLCNSMLSELEAAVGYYKKALELNPAYEEARVNLLITLADLGLYDEVDAELGLMLASTKLPPDALSPPIKARLAEGYRELAALELEMGRPRQAERLINEAVELTPSFVDLLVFRGKILRRAGRLDQAEEVLERALEANPGYENGWLELGLVRFQQGDYPAARKHLEKARELSRGKSREAELYLAFLKSRAGKDE